MDPDIFGYDVIVHPRICAKHGISEEDVVAAWNNALPLKRRDAPSAYGSCTMG